MESVIIILLYKLYDINNSFIGCAEFYKNNNIHITSIGYEIK